MPRPNLRDSKTRVRKSILELRNKQSPEEILQKSSSILTNLLAMKEYRTAKIVMLFSGKEKEVQTERLIRAALKDKRVVLPITNVKKRILEISEIKDYDLELELATFNIMEPKPEFIRPVPIDIIDLFVVPGVVFDYKGNRLGYGHAYYDKLLQRVQNPVTFIGLAFQFQVQKRLPHSRYDIPVHFIVTENKVINCRDFR